MANVNVTISHPIVIDSVLRNVGEIVSVEESFAGRIVAAGYGTIGGATVSEVLLGHKTAAQAVTNSAVLVNATDLVLSCLASRVYSFEAFVPYDVAAAADIAFKFTVPAAAAMLWTLDAPDIAQATLIAPKQYDVLTEASTKTAAGIAVATKVGAQIRGRILMGATPGPVQLQFAQVVATASACTISAGAFIKAARLS